MFVVGCGASRHFLQKADRIIFFRDSITQLGVKPKGYVTIIQDSLRALRGEITAEVIGAGISGNKIPDLQNRLQRDMLDKKPTVVVIYIGINDVWHYALPNLKGTPKEEFELGLKEIIPQYRTREPASFFARRAPSEKKNDNTNPQDAMLDQYSAIIRSPFGCGTGKSMGWRAYWKDIDPGVLWKSLSESAGSSLRFW